ncbi:efflux RND transporter periplasmic adaptor subunit [Thiomicrorhabdus xiamenensis]|uniref:Efflux RND transporter periplasmic adaptor subunit n=1 Tax=Thiomicrorhabdus xiamenensis TaxID=2739063 RepID=A0A7D4SM40_9GAMM|nr:efflux RND transporter periplasmic adaptor subunit [Thiomicrorhabdus xiamenensis]QKI88121.1 efflux RND transporter periplasmic adaptor subunit [Thiomicrorhabdus xiamenensis]
MKYSLATSHRKSFLPLVICSFLMLGLVHSNKVIAADGNAAGKQERPPMPVQVEKVSLQNFPYKANYPAQLAASKSVEVHARVTGIIEKQFYQEGQLVKAGDKLYQIDDRRYVAAKEQAAALLQSAKVQVTQSKINYDRVKKLREKQSVSIQDVDDAYTAWQVALADRDAAQAKLHSAQIELDDTTIEAEISGVIGQRQMDVGDLINPEAGVSLLNSITQTDPVYAHFSISDNDRQTFLEQVDAGLVKPFDTPKVALISASGSTIQESQVDFIDTQLDAATASQPVRATFANQDNRLLPGQFVRLEATLGEWQNMPSIPESSVMQVGAQAFVYVAKDGMAQMLPIQLAGLYQGRWLVKGGLKAGDEVITGNLIKLRPKTPVTVLPPQSADKNAGGK